MGQIRVNYGIRDLGFSIQIRGQISGQFRDRVRVSKGAVFC
jgi:hypothetical protein